MSSVLSSERRDSDEAGGRLMAVPALDLALTVFMASLSVISVVLQNARGLPDGH